jgi:phage terminase Nu1 subunit (DNA packaging protein)
MRRDFYLGAPMTGDDYLSERETATMLRHSQATLARWRKAGIGPACSRPFGRRVLYARTAVAEWIAAKTKAMAAPKARASRGRMRTPTRARAAR